MDYKQYKNPELKGSGNPNKIKILRYPRIRGINEFKNPKEKVVDERIFQKQIEIIDRGGFVSLTFEDYLLYLDGKLNLPKKGVIITFDDAYEEIYTIAFPIMQKYGMKGVVFAVAEPPADKNLSCNNSTGFKLLNSQQIIDLHLAGFEIGSHSLTHKALTLISNEDAWNEIMRSRVVLEILLNSPVKVFSYPYGIVNEQLKKLVSEAGYKIACGMNINNLCFGTDHFEVSRIKVANSYYAFYFQICSLYTFLKWLIYKVKTYFYGKIQYQQRYKEKQPL